MFNNQETAKIIKKQILNNQNIKNPTTSPQTKMNKLTTIFVFLTILLSTKQKHIPKNINIDILEHDLEPTYTLDYKLNIHTNAEAIKNPKKLAESLKHDVIENLEHEQKKTLKKILQILTKTQLIESHNNIIKKFWIKHFKAAKAQNKHMKVFKYDGYELLQITNPECIKKNDIPDIDSPIFEFKLSVHQR